MYKNVRQGIFKPKNPKKWIGKQIVSRSNLERRFFKLFDENPHITKIASEEFSIPYISPVDGKKHRYFVDLLFSIDNGKVFIAEIKPDSQIRPPKRGTKKDKTFLVEATTWAVNEAKWDAARAFAQKNGIEFIVLTEKHLKTIV